MSTSGLLTKTSSLREGKHKVGKFVINVLNDEKFSKVPIKYMDNPTTLGATDVANKTIYVRNTKGLGDLSKEINLLTLEHEIEEMVAKTSPHEEDGIRYKRGSDWLRPVATGVGFMLGGPLGAALGTAAFGGVRASQGKQSWGSVLGQSALAGGGGFLGSQAMGGFGGLLGQSAKSGLQGIGSSMSLGGVGSFAPSAMPAGVSAGGFSGGAGSLLGSAGMFGGGTGGGSASAMSAASPMSTIANASSGGWLGGVTKNALTSGNKMMSNFFGGNSGTGGVDLGNFLKSPGGMMGAGQMGSGAIGNFPTAPTPPNISPIIGKWLTQDSVTRAGAKAKEMADTEYGSEWAPEKETMAFIDVMGKDISKAYKRRKEDTDKMMSRTNDQWMTSGERIETLQRLDEEEQRETDLMAQGWMLKSRQDFATRQFEYINNQMNLDEQVKRDFLYGEIRDITMKYQVEYSDLMQYRQIAAQTGIYQMLGNMGAFGG